MSDVHGIARDQLRAFVERIEGECWKQIADFPDYFISDHGRVASLRSGEARLMKGGPGTSPMRYLRVTLTRTDGKKFARNIHVLVAEAFHGPRPDGMWALHRNGDVADCSAGNVYWGTPQDNSDDRVAHGRSGPGEKNPNVKLDRAKVALIRDKYADGDATQAQLAAEFGVRQAHVSRILDGRSWPTNGVAA